MRRSSSKDRVKRSLLLSQTTLLSSWAIALHLSVLVANYQSFASGCKKHSCLLSHCAPSSLNVSPVQQ